MARKKQRKPRNWHALNAILNRPAGVHTDRKKQQSKQACRGRVRENPQAE